MQLADLIGDINEVIPYTYEKIRTPELDSIITRYLAQANPNEHPVLIHMAGIPGAGKTTFYRTHQWVEHVFVAFDDVMEALPAYQTDLAKLGNAQAFKNWEIPARIVGYELLRRAVEEHKNIFFDNGGSSQAHLLLMKNIKKFGYKSEMYYISCALETAIARAEAREKEINRHIPIETISERYFKTLINVKEYKKIVDVFHHFDSSETGFIQQAA
jgi:probable phosphoglycerate mutase